MGWTSRIDARTFSESATPFPSNGNSAKADMLSRIARNQLWPFSGGVDGTNLLGHPCYPSAVPTLVFELEVPPFVRHADFYVLATGHTGHSPGSDLTIKIASSVDTVITPPIKTGDYTSQSDHDVNVAVWMHLSGVQTGGQNRALALASSASTGWTTATVTVTFGTTNANTITLWQLAYRFVPPTEFVVP